MKFLISTIIFFTFCLACSGEKVILLSEDSETGLYTNWQSGKKLEQDFFESKNVSVVSDWFNLKSGLSEQSYLIYQLQTTQSIKRIGVSTEVQTGSGDVFVSFDNKTWEKICKISKDNKRFLYSVPVDTKNVFVKFSGNIQMQGPVFWIDCKKETTIEIEDKDSGSGRIQLVSFDEHPFLKNNGVFLKTEKNFQTIKSKFLPFSILKEFTPSTMDNKKLDAVFFLKNQSPERASGFLEVFLPEDCKGKVDVFFFYFGKRIDQAPDRIVINGKDLGTPSAGGDHWANPLYPSANRNDTMEFIWNKLRKQSKDFISSHQFLRKGNFSYEYLTNKGEWKTFKPEPWNMVMVPEDASISPLHIRVKLLDEKGSFAAQAYTFNKEYQKDDFWLPVEDYDGRGNSLIGWKVLGVYPAGSFPASKTKGTKKRLVIFYTLEGDGNPLNDSPNNPDYGEIRDNSGDLGAYGNSSFSLIKLRIIAE